MNLSSANTANTTISTDLLAVTLSPDTWKDRIATLDEALGGNLVSLAQAEGFDAKPGQTFALHTLGKLPARKVLLVGLGARPLDPDAVKDLGGKLAQAAGKSRATSLAIDADWTAAPLDAPNALRLVAEGARLAAYKFDRYLSDKGDAPPLEAVTFLTAADTTADLARAQAVVNGVLLARDLVNEPPNVCTPVWLAEQAQAIAARYGLTASILDQAALQERGLNLLLAVGRGSVEESRLIHLTYTPEGEVTRRVAIVGKGVTFDTGGYNIKVAGSMMGMHCDMAGGAAVLGAAETLGQLRPAGVEVHFIVPSATNRVSSNAYTVNEIIKGYGGKTVEINNTDAEGRLLLADALAFAAELGVDEIIDLATLTGACVVALGEQYSAIFSNNKDLSQNLVNAASDAGERIWPMPLDEKLRDKLKSPVADMRNTGDRWGGAITAALFLKEWVGETAWAHIDIAGPAFTEAELPISPKGGTGAGVALLVRHIAG